LDKIAQSSNAKIITPIYPKVPHFNYKDTYPKILNLYKEILETVESTEQLTIMEDWQYSTWAGSSFKNEPFAATKRYYFIVGMC